ncbi:MAG: heparinase II/III family protein [Armatimonadia bacterium]
MLWHNLALAGLNCLLLTAALTPVEAVRDYGGRYTAERVANLRANCAKYDWAAAQRKSAEAAADYWVKKSDEDLWRMIPGQELPRAIDVSMYKGSRPGCPKCKDKINKFGNYPYAINLEMPFKLKCPSCGEVFPKNDFKKYYESGIDETGVFRQEKADKSLLFNAEHPDANDPLHKYGVDDGLGWYDETGHRYLFVAYYTWQSWDKLQSAVDVLSNAFVYSGDQKYAHKALIMLDRIADLYPDYDWAPYAKRGHYHSDGGGGRGKIEGSIWETGTVTTFATAVDRALSGTKDDPALYAFLAEKAKQFKLKRAKGTRELLVQNLDDGILREGAKAVYEKNCDGNEGMNQTSLATCAIALDQNPETEKWLDYLFEAKGEHIPTVVVGGIDRDGAGAEAAPGYALSWGINIGKVADLLAEYPGYTKHSIYRDFPMFKATFTPGWRIALLNYATPNIGDTGSCGSTGKVNCEPEFILRGYKYTGDSKLALAAYYANGNKTEGLGRDIFSADPLKIEREVAALAEKARSEGNPWMGGHNMAGYGLASLEYGWSKEGTGLWMYYGRNGGHGHADRLNFDIYYKGLCMLPDHGYPEYATNWPHRMYVTDNTLSHNTVLINGQPQKTDWVGHPELFCQHPDFGAVRVESSGVYPGLAKKYQRTLAFVKIGDGQGYALDIFRVQGGEDHLYSLHGTPGTVTSDLKLTKQEQGTYMGAESPYRGKEPRGPKYGYSWVTNVERDAAPAEQFMVDWQVEPGWRAAKAEDDIHVRYHSLTPLDDVALGDMEPPQNKGGNPRWLRYLLAHRTGKDLTSTFAGVIEPYSQKPAIAKVERLKVTAPDAAQAVAVKVTLADGAIDYLVSSDDDSTIIKSEGGPEFSGGIGWLRVRNGKVERASLTRGTRLALDKFAISLAAPGYTGKIVRMDRDMEGKGYVWVDAVLPGDETLKGQQIIIQNDRVRNACYEIESVEKDGNLTKLCLGEVCFIRDYKDRADYSKGFVYEFEEGAPFIIPNTVYVSRQSGNSYKVKETATVELTVGKE